jgi:uncharacterized protein (DUF2141 family)
VGNHHAGINLSGDSMKRGHLIRRLAIAALPGVLSIAAGNLGAQASAKATVTVSGKVLGASGKHTVYVALWNENSFLKKPVQQLQLKAMGNTDFQFHVAPGAWAISAYEDANENGVLDMGMFGPKEPSGFWRPFHEWRKPRFADVSTVIVKDTSNADIQLHK